VARISVASLSRTRHRAAWSSRNGGIGEAAALGGTTRDAAERGALGSACECGMTHEMWPRAASPKRATERLSRLEDSRLLYRLKHRWRDGTTHVVFTPRE